MLKDFLYSNFDNVIKTQDGFDHDREMIQSIQDETLTVDMIKDWMRDYGLFQGIKKEVRNKIAEAYIEFAYSNRQFSEVEIGPMFQRLHERFKGIETRRWLSATSKLLWCMQPELIVIYDAFVARAVLVLQCLNEELAKFPRIGTPPNAKKDPNSELMTTYYLNYQDMVKAIYEEHSDYILSLKAQQNADYSYDLRIMDKLLWIMGNFNEGFQIRDTVCERRQKTS